MRVFISFLRCPFSPVNIAIPLFFYFLDFHGVTLHYSHLFGAMIALNALKDLWYCNEVSFADISFPSSFPNVTQIPH